MTHTFISDRELEIITRALALLRQEQLDFATKQGPYDPSEAPEKTAFRRLLECEAEEADQLRQRLSLNCRTIGAAR